MSSYLYQKKFQELWEARIPFVSILLVKVRGSVPQDQGAKMLVTRESTLPFVGTVGGGKIEAKVIAFAQEMLINQAGKSKDFLIWNLQRDVGMTCGGEVQLYFEVYFHRVWEVAIFGAGHVAQALIPLLLTIDCHITCIDSRQEWIDKLPQSSRLKLICTDNLASEVKNLPPHTFILSMTKGHSFDLPVLIEILSTRIPPYLGVIGSESKANVLKMELEKAKIPKSRRESFFCPMGLSLGGNSPAEIAISIMAQLLQERDLFYTRINN